MSLYGVIGYHATLSEGHITPYKETLVPHLVVTLIYLSHIYSYYIRGDLSPLTNVFDKWQIVRVIDSTCKVWGIGYKDEYFLACYDKKVYQPWHRATPGRQWVSKWTKGGGGKSQTNNDRKPKRLSTIFSTFLPTKLLCRNWVVGESLKKYFSLHC